MTRAEQCGPNYRRPDRRLDEPVTPAAQVVYDLIEEYVEAIERFNAFTGTGD